jgi:acetyltransferase-like isoleucine patch superfamily enzyme
MYVKALCTAIRHFLFSFKGLGFLFNFLVNGYKYKHYSLFSSVYLSVRVEGRKYISIGSRTVVQRHGWLLALKTDEHVPELTIGKGCAIGDFCHITAIRKVIIEDNVLMANKIYISDNLHEYTDITTPVIQQPVLFKSEVTIGNGSWIGENVCIIGANVGRNSVIGANSVVTKDIPDYCIASGAPARIIKRYNFELNNWIAV